MAPLGILALVALLGLGAHAAVDRSDGTPKPSDTSPAPAAPAAPAVAAASAPSASVVAASAPGARDTTRGTTPPPDLLRKHAAPVIPPTPPHTAVLEFTPRDRHAVNQLKLGTQLALPDSVRTVQQAANYLLTPTGYSLMVPNDGFREAVSILNRPVSLDARGTGLTTIESALLIVAGEDVRLVVDHVNKLVSFEPNT